MQNNFSKCREWVPRGTSQHKWRWLTTLLLILTLGIGQMWAAETIFSATFKGSWSQAVKESDNNKVVPTDNVTLSPSGVSAIAYTTRTGSTGRNAQISSNAYKIDVATDLFLKLVLASGTTIQEGDVIRLNGSSNKTVVISDEASTSSKPTASTNTDYVVPSGSALIGKGVVYLTRSTSSTTLTSITIVRPDMITLDANGGKVNGENSIAYGIAEAEILPRAEKGSMRFVGWYDDPTAGTLKAGAFSKYTPAGNTTLYAHYADDCASSGEIYSFSINPKPAADIKAAAAAGSVVELVDYADCDDKGTASIGNNSTNQYVYVKSSDGKVYLTGSNSYLKLELACPLEEGDEITFVKSNALKISYTYNAASGTTSDLASGTNTFTIPAESGWIGKRAIYCFYNNNGVNITSVSINRPAPAATHTLAWDFDGGSTTSTTHTAAGQVAEGATITYPADNTMSKSGSVFDGWSSSATEMPASDLTITAQWATAYTVTFAANGGGGTMGPRQYKATAEVPIPDCGFSPEDGDHAFTHWTITGVPGKTTGNPGETFDMPAGPVTLTAQWAASYGITKGSHTNGDFTIDPTSAAAGTEITLAATPGEGYLFGAWEVVKTSDGTDAGVTVTNNKFEMPAFAVTVNATFVADTRKKILYLTSATTEGDKLYEALKDDYNVTVAAPEAQNLTNYDLVVLHESIGGNTAESGNDSKKKQVILDIPTTTIPVLNTKSYFYTSARWNWGGAANGKKTKGMHVNTAYCNIASHPLFDGLTPDANDSIIILSSINGDNKPMQPVTSFTSGKEGYTLANVPDGCAIHELTPTQRGVASGKYLLISIYNKDLNNLNANGQKLFQNAAAYLIGSTAWTPVEGLGTTTIDATGNPFSEGATMTLTASATGATASTTYAWYKGDTWAEAEAAGTIQAAKTAENSGHIYTKTAASEDAGTYWCVMVKSTGCEATASVEVSVLSCTKPGTPANLVASDLAYTTANLSWDAAANANGYKISIIKKDDESIIVDWTDNATTSYAATGLTQGTEYTLKVKAVGATGYCEFGLEATVDFTTTAPSVADLVTIDADYTFEPSVNIPAGTLSADSKFFAAGSGDCDMSDGKMRVKENRALAFKVADKAKIKVTFATKSGRQIQLGTAMSEGNYDTYGSSESSPYTFDVVTTGGVVYLTAHNDQLYFSKLEIIYPRTVTYDLNGGTGTQPTESAHYEGDKFTVHNGETDITAPSGQEFDKWKDQDNADVAGGAEYTMPAKAVTLTAQWRAETVKYTVTYDLDDYTAGVAPTETDKAAGDVFAIKAAPSRDGYAFMGWLCNIDAQTYQATDDYTMTAAATTFTAVWKQEFQVTYNLQGHGDPIAPQIVVDGAKATKPADPVADGFDFGGWFTDEECTAGNEFDFNTSITAATPLYAKWTTDPCPDKKSIVKAVMATNTTATVTGYNSNEYAGGYIVNNLADDASNTNMHDFGEGEVKGFKLKGSNSAIFATLSKGSFVAGDQVVFAVTKNAGDNKLAIYAAKDKDHVLKLVELDVDAAGIYTYRLTQDNIDAIEAAGSDYLSIGTFRGDYNPYIYSVELKGCRSWAIFHTLTFKNFDGTATIAAEPLEEGAYASTVAPVAPKIAMKRFKGWSESIGGSTVDLTSYTITEDKTLYAVYEDIVCPTNGTVYKFEIKDELPSENLPTSTDKDMSSYITATGDGYLTYTATANNKATINSDGTIQMKDASAAYLKVELECALAAGDQIRAHVTNNPMRVQVGTTYNSDKDLILAKNAYEFVAITSAMEGKQVLYITRSSNGNAYLADFEIYRPAKYDVSFDMMGHGTQIADIEDVIEGSKITAPTAPTDEGYSFAGWYKENTLENEWKFDVDVVETNTTLYAKWLDKSDATLKSLKYGETEIALEAGVYTYNVSLPAFTSAVPALTAETSNPNATKVIANAAAFDSEGNATSTVTVTPEVGADQVYYVNFAKGVEILLQDVTGSITWNFANAVTGTVNITGTPQVLANYGGVTNDNTFESDKLEASGEKFTAGNKANLRANYIHFHTTVPGMLTISYSNTGDNTARYIYVNGAKYDEDGSASTTKKGLDTKVFVPAGDVELVMKDGEGASKNVQIYQMIFNATPDYTRPVTEGRYGTICLPNGGVMTGASIYTLAYYGETSQKIFFDEVVDGTMEAGKPYLFLPNEGIDRIGVFYTDAANEPNKTVNGFVGYIGASEDPEDALQVPAGDGNYIVQNNQYREILTGATAYILSHRAYIHFAGINTSEPAKAPGARRIGISGAPQVVTGVDGLNVGDQPVKLIIDGQMYILRGDKMYDATGRLVK